MRGEDRKQTAMYSYVTLSRRIPDDHPARRIRALADAAFERMDADFDDLYAATGRPSIAPERGDERRSISQRKRKLVEKVFGWAKGDSVLRQVKVRGLKRVDWFYRFAMAAYNIMRLRRRIPIQPAA